MQFVMFLHFWLDKMNKIITKRLKKFIRLFLNSDDEFWCLFRELKELKTLKTVKYLTTCFNKLANGLNEWVVEIIRKSTNRVAFQQPKNQQLTQTATFDKQLKTALDNAALIIIHKKNTLETLKKTAKNSKETSI